MPASELRPGDLVVCEAGDLIPGDGEVVEGVASVDESAITGESAPVIRESGGDRSAVTGGTRVLSDRIVVRITQEPGASFLDRMIALVEGTVAAQDAERDRPQHPDRRPDRGVPGRHRDPARRWSRYAGGEVSADRADRPAGGAHPHHDRRAAVRDRDRRHGPAGPAQRAGHERPRGGGGGRRGHAPARQDGHHHARQPPGRRVHPGAAAVERARPGRGGASSPRWPTRRRRGARSWCWPRSASACASGRRWPSGLRFVPFSAETRMSGVEIDGTRSARGRPTPIEALGRARRAAPLPDGLTDDVERVARAGRHPAGGGPRRPGARRDPPEGRGQGGHDPALRPSCAHMGIRTVMITGDNRLTAAAIAAEAGVDDFLAQATPEDKMALIREEQAQGPAGRDDRRRDQRRARAGPGRRGRGDEHRHPPPRRPGTWSTSTPTRPS